MSRPSNALIVDDEAHVRTFLRLVLKEVGIETVWEARDGDEGVAMVTQHRPQLVLLDLNLPVVDGMAALGQIRQIVPDTPVIVVSSQNAMKTVLETARLGAIGYVLKQNSRQEVLAALTSALETLDAEEEA